MAYDEIKVLNASDAANDDGFGAAVALSYDGSVIAVGATGEDGAGSNRGKVYVYSGSDWGTETMLTASDAGNNDLFGVSVAISDDGTVIAVGAPYEDGAGTDRGKVYVYSGSDWGTETMLTASDAGNNDLFGLSVAISGDGTIVVSGAQSEDGAGTDRGKVYVYSGASWGTETQITASDTANNDKFGSAVSASTDGTVIVVGAIGESGNKGKAYVYSGTSWGTETMLTASDGHGGVGGDEFGNDVDVSDDGSIVVVASDQWSNGGSFPNLFIGKVYAYTGSSWGTETGLIASDATYGAFFGTSLGLSGDGDVVYAGAPFEDVGGSNIGEGYAFTGASWGTEQQLFASDAAVNDAFGIGGGISGDGSTIAVGAPNKNSFRGRVYVFGTATMFVPQIYRRL